LPDDVAGPLSHAISDAHDSLIAVGSLVETAPTSFESIVTRSISGHLTERMQHHYSTLNADKQRSSIGRVIDLMAVRSERAGRHETSSSPVR